MNKRKIREIGRIMNLMAHKKVYIICMLISCSAYSIYQIMTSFVNMYLINSIIEKDMEKLIISFFLLMIAIIMSTLIDPIVTYKFNQCINTTMLNLREKTFAKIKALGNLQVKEYTSGDLISRMTNDISMIEKMFGNEAYVLITSILYGVGSSISMFCLNWRFSLIIFVMAITSVSVGFYFGPILNQISCRVQKKHAVLNQCVIDAVLGSKTIKVFGIHDYFYEKYIEEYDKLIQDEMARNRINATIDMVNFLVNALNIIGAFSIGAYMVYQGTLDFGTIIAVIGLQRGVVFMFERVGRYYAKIQTSLAASARIFEIHDKKAEDFTWIGQQEKLKRQVEEEAICLENVTFGYSNQEEVVQKLSLRIKKGEIIAITGASGQGKSTLIKLILGFYPLKEGQIYVNNKKVNEENIKKIRDEIAYVPQDTFLFEETINQNIACNQKTYTYKDVVEAAKKANVHDFIMSLPKGYQTIIRENANNLSSGQKQRIAIARAFFKNAPIILMDEPTASLDAESEAKVKQTLEELCYGKTVIIIAHQSTLLNSVTKTYVFDHGVLKEVC